MVTMKRILLGLSFDPLRASVINAMMPPSPLLSARIIKMAYLVVTTNVNDQKISDNTPSI